MRDEAGDELIGRTLGGKFTITGFIGKGAMASVFRGRHDGDPPEVAVKVMHPMLGADPTFGKRFLREAKAAAKLNHPRSVRIFEYGSDSGMLYIAMELLEGSDLFDALLKERRMPEARAVGIMIQVCGALVAAHEHGIVHRDLKPENIMLMKSAAGHDEIKVLDFGIAKILDRETGDEAPPSSPFSSPPSSNLTRVGTIIGTPEYMSPEQCRGETIDARSDIYACGVVLYQMLTGRTPFVGQSPVEIALKHVTDDPPALSAFVPGINPKLDAIIMKALSKWPAQRQESAAELERELSAVAPELSGEKPRNTISITREAVVSSPSSAPEISVHAPRLPGLPSDVTISAEHARAVISGGSGSASGPFAPTPPVISGSTLTPASGMPKIARAPQPPAESDAPKGDEGPKIDAYAPTLDLSKLKSEITALEPPKDDKPGLDWEATIEVAPKAKGASKREAPKVEIAEAPPPGADELSSKEHKTKAEEPKAETEEPKAEEPKAEEPKAETEEPKVKAEEPKAKAEAPKVKEPKAIEPKAPSAAPLFQADAKPPGVSPVLIVFVVAILAVLVWLFQSLVR